MSAICGVLHLDGRSASPEAIAAMSAALAHRGSDASGSWCDAGGPLAVAHRMRHTTMESLTEIQPVVHRPSGLVLVADARIDNRDELISALGIARGARATDSEIILAAYERWREDCAVRLIGDFAFAIWDARARTLFCARDAMGVKPFYYYKSDRTFAFATEVKALLTLPEVSPAIDDEQVALLLGASQHDRSRTIYSAIHRLPAAHNLRIGIEHAPSLTRYWELDPERELHFASDGEYAEAFRERFAAAVGARLRSAHPIGATLSGGLDSSAVVCMARQLRTEAAPPLQTFSLVFPSLPERELRRIDERSYMNAVIRGGGVQPHFVRGDELSPLTDLRRILWHLDEPHCAPNLYLHWGMFGAAESSGVRVFLDGFDGDTTVSHGFGRLTGLARSGDWDLLETEARAFGDHHARAPDVAIRQYALPYLGELARRGHWIAWMRTAGELARRFGLSRREIAKTYGLRAMVPPSFQRSRRSDDLGDGGLLLPALRAVLRRRARDVHRAESRRLVQTERQAHLEGLGQPLYELTLELADKSAAAFGLEPRYPFFDRRLVEFCVAMPEAQKFAGGWPRLLFRRSMEGILPREVQWRSMKANLSPNFVRRFRECDAAALADIDVARLAPYVHAGRLQRLVREYGSAGDAGHETSRRQAAILFRAAILGTWLDARAEGMQRVHHQDAHSPAAA